MRSPPHETFGTLNEHIVKAATSAAVPGHYRIIPEQSTEEAESSIYGVSLCFNSMATRNEASEYGFAILSSDASEVHGLASRAARTT